MNLELIRPIVLGLLLAAGAWDNAAMALPSGSRIPVNGRPTFLVGANYPWLAYGSDLAGTDIAAIRTDFRSFADSGGRVMRWWLFADGLQDPALSLGEPKPVSEEFMANMQAILGAARERGIMIEWSVLDFYYFKRTDGRIVTDPVRRKAFIERTLTPVLKRFGNHPGVFAWDAMNEPEEAIRKEDGGNGVCETVTTLEIMRAYINDVADAVHANTKQYATVGSQCLKFCGMEYDFYSPTRIDYYEAHYYGWMNQWFDPLKHPYEDLKADRPCVIGEFPADGGDTGYTTAQILEGLYDNGYAGALGWSWRSDGDGELGDRLAAPMLEFVKARPAETGWKKGRR